MATRKFTVAATSNSGGAATVYTPYLTGYIESIQYVKTDYANGVDFTITAEATGEAIWVEQDVNAAVTKLPRAATHDVTGVAAVYASGGSAVNDRIALARDRAKIVLASAGDTKTGSFVVIVSDQ